MSDTALQNALLNIILPLGITPQSTLTAQATAGATTVTVASAAKFVPGGFFTFSDALGEETLIILSKAGNVLTLDFTGTGYAGLQFTHPNATVVYTNLCTDAPLDIGPMLALGDPFIFIMALDEKVQLTTTRMDGATLTMHIQYHKRLNRPDDQQMDPNLWGKRQQSTARADIETIAHAIRTNRRLVVNGNQMAIDLGERGNPSRPHITKTWRKLTTSADTEQFIAALDVVVQDLWQSAS